MREKPLLIYDGDCGFCRRRILQLQALTGDRVEYAPSQEVAGQFPEIPAERFEGSVQLVETDGKVYQGAEAVFRTMAHAPRRSWLLWMYLKIPGWAPLSEWGYQFIARHRGELSSTAECSTESPIRYERTRWIFLRGLGLIYLVAFLSFWTQVRGLIGAHGILPVSDLLQAARQQLGAQGFWAFPSLCWLNGSDGFLQFLCEAGVLFSLLLIAGILPVPSLILLWAFYLSLSSVAQEFMGFQWDILLLETGFLAVFFAPLGIRPRVSGSSPPSRLVLWLLRWLAFRLLFSSGAVKLLSGDPTWRNLTALMFHYETQPLPTWIGWYAHQLPAWFQRFSTSVMFALELGVPWFFFGPRRVRFLGAFLAIGFQGLIMATGNYCFFNGLAILLCLLLLDDSALPHPFALAKRHQEPRTAEWPRWILIPVAGFTLLVTSLQMAGTLRIPWRWPRPAEQLMLRISPLRSFNSYGLFAMMTTSRPEIIVEGSRDGSSWLPYEFKYKPDDPKKPPRFVAPHQPRLDWQLWFAALGGYEANPWFMNFCVRLLQGSPDVISLLKKNPFPGKPPRFIRAAVYDYRFTDFKTRRETGAWWRREYKGMYCPILSLRESHA